MTRSLLFLIGVSILIIYFNTSLSKLGVFGWFIPLIGLGFMGLNPFALPNSKENKEVESREFNHTKNFDDYKELDNPHNDINLLITFIKSHKSVNSSFIFFIEGKKQIVKDIFYLDDKDYNSTTINGYDLIDNTNKTYNLNKIQQIKYVKNYYWEKVKLYQDFNQIRDYFKKYIKAKGTDLIRLRGNDCYSWELADELKFNFEKGEITTHHRKYITISLDDFFLNTSNQNVIKKFHLQKNHIVAFDYHTNNFLLFKIEKIVEYEILYS